MRIKGFNKAIKPEKNKLSMANKDIYNYSKNKRVEGNFKDLKNIKLLEQGIIAKPHTAPYKIHRYFARRPWNVFNQLINIFSSGSDIVLDPFCGGGVTIYEGIRLGRKVVGFDLNPLAIFIVNNMINKNVDLRGLNKDFQILSDYLEDLYSPYEAVEYPSQQKTLIEKKKFTDWYELAHVIYCNYCNEKIVLSNKNKLRNGRYICKNINCKVNRNNGVFVEPKNCKRDGYQYLFSVTTIPDSRKRIIKELDESDQKRIKDHIQFLKDEIKKNKIAIPQDKIPLNWDRQNEDLLKRKNIHTFQDLFTKRNLYVILLLLSRIKTLKTSKENNEILRFVFSNSLRDTNIMAFTNENWQSGRPTTWAKHAYWIPSQFCELNVLYAFKKSFKAIERALRFNEKQPYFIKKAKSFKEILKNKNYYVVNDSLDNSDIPKNKIDAVITDPPYGSNVQYLELSHFWYVWNRDLYPKKKLDFSKEAVKNRKRNFPGAKSYYDYEENLYKVFRRAFHVLKDNKYMVMTFNNRDINAWLALLISIFRAGFSLEEGGLYFQDGIKNYKQTAHTKAEGSPYGDFIYVFKKSTDRYPPNNHMNQDELLKLIEEPVRRYLQTFKEYSIDRNEIKRIIFLKIIPYIERFVKSNLQIGEKHNLYDIFKRDFLKELYKKILVARYD